MARFFRHKAVSLLHPPIVELHRHLTILALYSDSGHHPIRDSLRSLGVPQELRHKRWDERAGAETAVAAGPQDDSNLCRRCRRLTIPYHGLDDAEWEDCRNDPGWAHATEEAAAALTKLSKTLSLEQLNTIRVSREGFVVSPAKNIGPLASQVVGGLLLTQHCNQPSEQCDEFLSDCPPIAEVGLTQTFNWILERIHFVNDLADKFVQNVRADPPNSLGRQTLGHQTTTNDALIENMKRRLNTASEEARRLREEGIGPTSDAKPYTRRRSLAPTEENSDIFPSLRSNQEHRSSPSEGEMANQTDVMNPPPAPTRQLPSPPGRSLPSPTSIDFPSPSSGSYGAGPLPPPLNIHHPALSTYLPPIGSTHTPDALQAHSAALQHEVSVQKIALSSLQGEHDKLLAAFSRSQLRASTLEKRHVVSDTEINTLTEEKLRLQTQVLDLERDVEELTRSRDETRQAAVQDGAQYMDIIQKASQLGIMAGEEKKRWNELKAEMQARMESLSSGTAQMDEPSSLAITVPIAVEGILTPVSSAEAESRFKIESRRDLTSMLDHTLAEPDDNDRLRGEVRRLRIRCAEVEDALRAIRSDTRSMGGIVEALNIMRKSSSERANKALGGCGAGDHGEEGKSAVQ